MKWVIIDEISMIPAETLNFINKRLGQLQRKEREDNSDGNEGKPFGGLSVLLFGDLLQLKPVNGHWIFDQYSVAEPYLWKKFQFHELRLNVRQRGDPKMLELCNCIRDGCIEEHPDIRQILIDNCLDNLNPAHFHEAIRVVPRNALASNYNEMKLEELQAERQTLINQGRITGKPIYVLQAKDTHMDRQSFDAPVEGKFIPSDTNKTGVPTRLGIAPGVRIMLPRNLAISKGLVNGAMGFITSINWGQFRKDQLYEGDLPESVEVNFDGAGKHNIRPLTIEFDGNRKTKIKRTMLHCILCWAITAHKTQGMTIPKAVIDIGKRNFAHGQIYVPISRVQTIEGLATQNYTVGKLTKKSLVDQRCLSQLEILRGDIDRQVAIPLCNNASDNLQRLV